jgi:cytochrome c
MDLRRATRQVGGAGLAVLVFAACGGEPTSTVPVSTDIGDGIVTAATVTEPADRLDSVPADAVAVLVYTRTLGFRHDVLGAPGTFAGPALAALRELAAADPGGGGVEFTEDPAAFTDGNLARFDAVVFLNTTGDVLDAPGEGALQRYVEGGGGFAGVHSATDTEYEWPWYGALVGAYFASHPAVMPAVVVVEDADHPSTAQVPAEWERTDEWYAFRTNPGETVHVLATLDESTYEPGESTMGTDHPIVWCRSIGAGRSWYTALGHTAESYAEPAFRAHLWNGIKFAAGALAGEC